PLQAGEAVFVAPESQELDVEETVHLVVAKMLRKPVRDHEHGIAAQLGKERLRIGKEEEVCVEIGDLVDVRPVRKHEERQGGRDAWTSASSPIRWSYVWSRSVRSCTAAAIACRSSSCSM